MEACGGAHFRGREIGKLGPEVRLIPPASVKPFAKARPVLAPPPETPLKARNFAAGLGLMPRQHSTRGKQRLGATTKWTSDPSDGGTNS
jgi:transposase